MLLSDPPLTTDVVTLMRRDNVVGEGVPTFADLGLAPTSVKAVLPVMLGRGHSAEPLVFDPISGSSIPPRSLPPLNRRTWDRPSRIFSTSPSHASALRTRRHLTTSFCAAAASLNAAYPQAEP